MKWASITIGLIVVLSLLSAAGFRRDVATYDMSASVAEKKTGVGVSVDADRISFGEVGVGSNVTKVIKLSNDDGRPMKIVLESEGNISGFLEYEKELYLSGNEERSLKIRLLPTSSGSFTGRLIIKLIKPRSDWLSWMLPVA